MTALAPLAAAALAGWWVQDAPLAQAVLLPTDLVPGDVVWAARIGVSTTSPAAVAPAPFAMMAGLPTASAEQPSDLAEAVPQVLVSDRGWTGEPADASAPNVIYPARLLDPPALEAGIPILPEGSRRLLFTGGEVRLANGDGTYDSLAGNWSIGGRAVELLRGPHTRPAHAALSSFVTVARLRAASAASGTTRLTVPLTDAAASLLVPACDTYGGTGGADGTASLAGQPKPRLYGLRRQVEPVLEDPARLIYRAHHGAAVQAITAVRDRGVDLTNAGDVATYAALQAASPSAGTFLTCLAEGCLRLGATPSLVTIDAQGDVGTVGYSGATPASIARKLLTGPGGLAGSAIDADAFLSWPVGASGLYLRGGTVADALDALAGGVAGWWGANRLGLISGGRIAAPEGLAPVWSIQPWMLRAPPEEASGGAPPRWRARVGYGALGRVFSGEDFAGAVAASTRELWGKPYQTSTSADLSVLANYPLAQDPEVLVSCLDAQSDADALSLYLRQLHAVPRRTWRVQLNRAGVALACGQAVQLTWPRHGLASGRTLLVRSLSLRGDRTEALLWG